jgi:hypothetical protein
MVSNAFESLITYQRTADAGIPRLVSLGEWPLLAYFVSSLGMVAWFSQAIRQGLSRLEILIPALVLALMSLLAGRPWFNAVLLLLILIPVLHFITSRKVPADIWGAGLMLWWMLAALGLYFSANASYLFIWPLASVLLGIAVQIRLQRAGHSNGRFITMLAAAIIPLMMLSPIIIMAYLALGSSLPQGIMILSVLCLILIWPLARHLGSGLNGKAGPVLFVAGLMMTLVVMFGRGFDARHPRGEALFFAIDADQQQAFWVSPDARPGSWLGQFMGEDASEANMTRLIPGYDEEVLFRHTSVPSFEAATLEITGDRKLEGERELSLHLQSPAAAEYLNLLFPGDAGISSVTVNGFPVPLSKVEDDGVSQKADAMKEKDKARDRDWWRWRWLGLPLEGADIVLRLKADRPLAVKIVEVDYGMPEGAPQRPGNSMPKIYTWSDSTVIFQTLELD